MHPDDLRVLEIWEELTCLFSKNEEDTIRFLNSCNKEYLTWIGEVFEDISERLQSIDFLQCLEDLNIKYPELCLADDIMYARRSLKTGN